MEWLCVYKYIYNTVNTKSHETTQRALGLVSNFKWDVNVKKEIYPSYICICDGNIKSLRQIANLLTHFGNTHHKTSRDEFMLSIKSDKANVTDFEKNRFVRKFRSNKNMVYSNLGYFSD